MVLNICVSSLRNLLHDTAGVYKLEVAPGCLESSVQPWFRVKFVGKILRAIQANSVFARFLKIYHKCTRNEITHKLSLLLECGLASVDNW
jgi:hypothetical protein